MNLTEVFGMFRSSTLTLVAIAALATPGTAQIMVPRGGLQAQSNAPRLLVANPFTPSAVDSAAAVEIGDGLRERMARSVVGRDFNVISREQMNTALSEWGYPADAVLNASTSKTFAIKTTARTIVQSTLAKNAQGLYTLTARFVGTASTEPAGVTVSMTQAPGQKLDDLGSKTADLFRPAVRAIKDARSCIDQAATDPVKAAEAAQKALKVVPNHGLAEFCLGALAAKRDSVSDEAISRYRAATVGDPLAWEVHGQIAVIQQLRGDSAGAIQSFQTMLRLEPTNQLLRDQAFGLFNRYGRPEAAEEVAEEGIRIDPANVDWYDLKSNACLAQQKFTCAVDELERAFLVDSTRADTTFFKKIAIAAKFGEDTVRFLKWTQAGAEKYPSEVSLADELAKAFAMSGMPDSAVAASQRLMMLDETRIETLSFVADLMAKSGFEDARKAVAFVPYIKATGTEDDWNVFGNVMVNAASAARTAEARDAQAELAQAVLDVGATNPTLTSYAGFFIAETMVPRFQALSQAIRSTARSCADAQAYKTLLGKFMPAARLASTADNDAIKQFGSTMLGYEAGETQAAAQAVSQFCN
jgi:tetratricopeptide (TPR) repeat protein